MRTILLAGVAALTFVTARPSDAQMPVIDIKSINQLVDQLKVLQQQLQQAEQIYQETIGVYNQTVSIVKSVSASLTPIRSRRASTPLVCKTRSDRQRLTSRVHRRDLISRQPPLRLPISGAEHHRHAADRC